MLRLWNDTWSDFDQSFAWMDAIRRELNQSVGSAMDLRGSRGFPALNMHDAGDSYLIQADLPGMNEKEVNVEVNQDVLTISGERKMEVPEGYREHRRERAATRFTRSISFPSPIDREKATASVKDGVLTVRLSKSERVKPRQISVKAE
jgi:HSP20 family protein